MSTHPHTPPHRSGARLRATAWATSLALVLQPFGPVWAQTVVQAVATTASDANIAKPRAGEPIVLTFQGAEIEAIARAIASATGRNIVVDPRVKGVMTLITDRAVSPATAYNQFSSMLRLQGFAIVDANGLLKVIPEADAKVQGGAVSVAGAGAPGGNQIVTKIFKLTHETANNLVPVLRPLISPNNTINVNPGNNSLVITDYADNLQRIGQIISSMDVANATDVEVILLKHAIAQDISGIVLRLTDASGGAAAGQGQADTSFKTTIIPEPRANALIVRTANVARMNLVRSIVEKLDQPSSAQASGNIHVVYLKNADATKLAATLRSALAGSAAAAAPATGAAGAAAVTTGGQIQADTATNSLIITASEPQFRQLRAVIAKLDERRAQILVESVIAEVSNDQAAEFGIQWQGALGNKGDGTIGVLGTNFGSGGSNIVNLASQRSGAAVAPSKGFNLGLTSNTNGVYVLGFLARFLEQSGEGNVLSTPYLLTMDNEEAKIVIGQNVPFVTGQFTNSTGAGGSVNPFQTIERKDVGLTLRVKPQISENGSVRLQIFQETSSVDAASRNSPSGLITNKRAIESNVMVENGGIVVLGGLIQDEYSGGQEKIPVVGDLPFFGNLFKTEQRNRKKTNLMVFLRPVVVRDAVSSADLSYNRYESMRANQQATQPTPSTVLPVNQAPVLPALAAPGAQPAREPKAGAPAPAAPK